MGVAIGSAVGGIVSSAILRATSAITGFFMAGITGAVNLGESISKVDAVFGESAGIIKATAESLARDFGLSKQSILDAGAGIGLVGKAAGQSQAQAAAMGSQMAKLAADAASFYNVPLDVALEKIRSGLVGEAEPLRAFGVLLSEEAVAAEAVAMGLAKSAKEVDQQGKVLARASLITKGMKDATGDLERTADSSANQWRKLTGTIENLAVEIGTALLPAINSLLTTANSAAQTIAIVWRNLPDIWEIVRLSAIQMAQNVTAAIGTIPENAAIVGEYLANNWVKLISDGANAVMAIFTNLGENIHELGRAIGAFLSDPTKGFHVDFKPLLEGFKATADALPELVKPALNQMQEEIDAVAQRIADREGARAAAAKDKAKATTGIAAGTAAAAAGKTAEFKSESSGLADFSARLREQTFSAKSDIGPKQLAATERTAKAAEATVAQLKKGIPALMG